MQQVNDHNEGELTLSIVHEDLPTLSVATNTSEEVAPAEGSSASATGTDDENTVSITVTSTDTNVQDLPPATAEQPNEAAARSACK